MTVRIAQPCGCRQESFMGQKRDRLCEHRNVFERPDAQGRTTAPRRRHAPLRPGKGFAASKQQRQKVRGLVCVGCGREASEDGSVVIDPAHVWPKGKGAEELAHPIAEHGVSLVALVRRLTGSDWEFTRRSTTEEAAKAAPEGAVQ
jgi:hypothetical protein